MCTRQRCMECLCCLRRACRLIWGHAQRRTLVATEMSAITAMRNLFGIALSSTHPVWHQFRDLITRVSFSVSILPIPSIVRAPCLLGSWYLHTHRQYRIAARWWESFTGFNGRLCAQSQHGNRPRVYDAATTCDCSVTLCVKVCSKSGRLYAYYQRRKSPLSEVKFANAIDKNSARLRPRELRIRRTHNWRTHSYD